MNYPDLPLQICDAASLCNYAVISDLLAIKTDLTNETFRRPAGRRQFSKALIMLSIVSAALH